MSPPNRSRRKPAPRPGRSRPSRVPRKLAAADAITAEDEHARGERLQKVLAAAGIASRRECEQFILEGRVEVDRQVVTELGTRVDPQRQEIRVDGEPLPRARPIYFAVNKPPGVVSTARDPAGRPRVIDLLPPNAPRAFPVGRLDADSEGLILVTNDGELANGLTHPRHGVEKIYHVQVAGHVEPEVLRQLQRGMHLAEGYAQAKHVRIKGRRKRSTILEMVLDEGRNREIRRLLARTGHKVQRLKRIAVGPVRLGELPTAAVRPLSRKEVDALHKAVERGPAPAPAREPTTGQSARPTRRKQKSHKGPETDKGSRTIIGE
jgi:23S rRNA pseudouridine2605 synthase